MQADRRSPCLLPTLYCKAYRTEEKEKLNSEIARIDKKLSNQGFVSKAPQQVVDGEKAKREKYVEMLNSVEERIAALN